MIVSPLAIATQGLQPGGSLLVAVQGFLLERVSQQPAGGFFGYGLGKKRAREEREEREEFEEFEGRKELKESEFAAQIAPQIKPQRVTRADIQAARRWADSFGSVPFGMDIQGFENAYAFPADARLTEDEAIALVLLLSET